MITGGTLRKDHLVLTTESVGDAKLVRSGISGRNNFIKIAPYGNHLSLKLDEQNLSISKEGEREFTFEEVHALLKKIEMFGRIKKRVINDLLESARHTLRSKLTLFFPSEQIPTVELAYAYNWAAMEFESEFFGKILPEIKRVVKKSKAPSIKVFSNNVDIISFHNYAMNGIYINRSAFEGIADVLTENRLLGQKSRSAFVLRTCAFGVKSVAYMESRRVSKISDDMFDVHQEEKLSSDMGDVKFFVELMDLFEIISSTGKISGLSEKQVGYLIAIHTDEEYLEQYNLPATIVDSITGFANDFATDITAISVNAA